MPATIALDARDAFAPALRGWGRHVRELARALTAIGAPVRVITGRWPGPEVVWEQAALPLAALAHRDALLHAPNCFLPLVRPCPGVVTVHDLAFEAFPEDFAPRTRLKYRVLARAAARSAERVICVSQATADDVAARWRVPEWRLRVVPNAPALPVGDAPLPGGQPYVLGVGDLRAKKAWDVLVEGWRRAGVPHRLVIAGADAGEGARLRALGGERLDLPGYVDDARLDALLRGAAALVHPSAYEGFGLVVVEAMARGVPVVCADATALPETAGGAAALFAPGDADALAGALAEVLAAPGAWAERGRARAAEFSWERTARMTWDVYRELIG
jgi:glycosyltransferase involved in cell wall biosynthesis